MKVWRDYQAFLEELGDRFPAERAGIKRFYDECWRVFDSLNSLELKSLEEPRYLLTQFAKHPLACLTLASFLTTNTGDVARRHIKVSLACRPRRCPACCGLAGKASGRCSRQFVPRWPSWMIPV